MIIVKDNRHPLMHVEMNEDHKQSQHSGYVQKRCVKCGRMFLVARASETWFDTCGDEKNCKGGRSNLDAGAIPG